MTESVAEEPQAPDPPESPRSSPRTSVMLLGSGELGRELVVAFQRLGAEVTAVDDYADAPAHRVADSFEVANMTDPDELAALIGRRQPDYVVTETDAVAADALSTAAESGFADVVPTARATRLSVDREGMRRLAADELGLPTAPFWFAGSIEELTAVAEHTGYPLVVKPVVAVPGEGQSVLLRPDDIEAAWHRALSAGPITHNRVLVETVVEIDYEVTLLTVRGVGPSGPLVQFCEPIGHQQVDGNTLEAWQPQEMTGAALDAARSIAARIVNALGGRGLYGVEMLVRGDEVYFADVSARPYDSGLVTLRSQRLSEFEMHARAILGLPVDTIMISPGAAEVVYSGAESEDSQLKDKPDTTSVLADALTVPESDVRVFGRSETYVRRRLGVALATAPDVSTARDRVRQVGVALRKNW